MWAMLTWYFAVHYITGMKDTSCIMSSDTRQHNYSHKKIYLYNQLYKVLAIKVGHTTFWPVGTSILVLYVWNFVCKTFFHQRKREFRNIWKLLQPWQILKIESNFDEIKKITFSFILWPVMLDVFSVLPTKMIEMKKSWLFFNFRSFFDKKCVFKH